MSEFKIELKGAEELIQKLESLNAYRLDAVLRKNATQIFNRGRHNAATTVGGVPIDSAQLRNSMKLSEIPDGYAVGYGAEYAPHVEYGHRQQVGRYVPSIGKRLVNAWVPGQHFLQKNVEVQDPIFDADLKKSIEEELKGDV